MFSIQFTIYALLAANVVISAPAYPSLSHHTDAMPAARKPYELDIRSQRQYRTMLSRSDHDDEDEKTNEKDEKADEEENKEDLLALEEKYRLALSHACATSNPLITFKRTKKKWKRRKRTANDVANASYYMKWLWPPFDTNHADQLLVSLGKATNHEAEISAFQKILNFQSRWGTDFRSYMECQAEQMLGQGSSLDRDNQHFAGFVTAWLLLYDGGCPPNFSSLSWNKAQADAAAIWRGHNPDPAKLVDVLMRWHRDKKHITLGQKELMIKRILVLDSELRDYFLNNSQGRADLAEVHEDFQLHGIQHGVCTTLINITLMAAARA